MRRVSKLAAVVLAGSLGITSLAACGSTSNESSSSSSSKAGGLKVGMAYDVGGRGDQSFNDSAARGLDKAKAQLHVQTKELEAQPSESDADKTERLRQLAANGYNPVIAVGFSYAKAMSEIAPKYPKTRFALIDSTDAKGPNITNLVFAEQEGSYLVGVAAAKASKAHHVGFIGGVNTPLIKKFEAGFTQGVKATDPKAKVDVTYLTQPPDFTGFTSPDKGNAAAKGMLDKGADVIYSAAGSSGNGAIEAVAGEGKWAIGVDSDQYKLPALSAYKSHILTSMVKNVDTAVFDFVSSAKNGTASGGVETYDLKRGGVGFSTSNPALTSGEKAAMAAAEQQITSGKVKVRTTP